MCVAHYQFEAIHPFSDGVKRGYAKAILGCVDTLHAGRCRKHIKWYNKEVNEALFSQPYSRAKTVSTLMGKTSRTTISKYMDELVTAQILTPKKEGNEMYYINNDLIRILEG